MSLLSVANEAMRQMLVVRGVQSFTQTIDGHQMHAYRYQGVGAGPPALLVHGLGSSANAYARTLTPLGRRFRSVYAVDIPGNGFSPQPSGGPLSLRAQMQTVIGFIEQKVRGPVFLVGNSLGGAMTLTLAAERPDLVQGLALISPAGAKVAAHRLADLLKTFDVRSHREARAVTRRLFHRAPLPLLMFSGELRRLYASPTVRSVLAEVRPEDAVTEEMLAALRMPVLLLWGKSEKLLPYEGLDYFRAHLPRHAEVHEVAGFGHIPQMEQPKELVRRLVAFADAHRL